MSICQITEVRNYNAAGFCSTLLFKVFSTRAHAAVNHFRWVSNVNEGCLNWCVLPLFSPPNAHSTTHRVAHGTWGFFCIEQKSDCDVYAVGWFIAAKKQTSAKHYDVALWRVCSCPTYVGHFRPCQLDTPPHLLCDAYPKTRPDAQRLQQVKLHISIVQNWQPNIYKFLHAFLNCCRILWPARMLALIIEY